MFKKMQCGASLVEWIVLVVLVVAVLGAAALAIANAAVTGSEGTKDWLEVLPTPAPV